MTEEDTGAQVKRGRDSKRLTVRLLDEERSAVDAYAASLGKTAAEWGRERILSGLPDASPSAVADTPTPDAVEERDVTDAQPAEGAANAEPPPAKRRRSRKAKAAEATEIAEAVEELGPREGAALDLSGIEKLAGAHGSKEPQAALSSGLTVACLLTEQARCDNKLCHGGIRRCVGSLIDVIEADPRGRDLLQRLEGQFLTEFEKARLRKLHEFLAEHDAEQSLVSDLASPRGESGADKGNESASDGTAPPESVGRVPGSAEDETLLSVDSSTPPGGPLGGETPGADALEQGEGTGDAAPESGSVLAGTAASPAIPPSAAALALRDRVRKAQADAGVTRMPEPTIDAPDTSPAPVAGGPVEGPGAPEPAEVIPRDGEPEAPGPGDAGGVLGGEDATAAGDTVSSPTALPKTFIKPGVRLPR